MSSSRQGGRYIAAVILIVLGVLFLLDNFGVVQWLRFDKLWPLILVALGLALIFGPRRK